MDNSNRLPKNPKYKRTKAVKKIEAAIISTKEFCEPIRDIHWEPWGKCIEMQGIEGGWYVNSQAIGLNVEEACDYIMKIGVSCK